MHVKLHIPVWDLFMQTGRRSRFVYLLFAEPMPLGSVVTGGRSFICVLSPPPDYLGGWPRCMWFPFTKRGAPRERLGSSHPLYVEDHTPLRAWAPDPSGRVVPLEFTAGDLDSVDDGEEDDIYRGANPNGQAGFRDAWEKAIQGSLERVCRFARLVGASEQHFAEVYHGVAGLSEEKGD